MWTNSYWTKSYWTGSYWPPQGGPVPTGGHDVRLGPGLMKSDWPRIKELVEEYTSKRLPPQHILDIIAREFDDDELILWLLLLDK